MQRPVVVAQTPLLPMHDEDGEVEGIVVGRRRPAFLLVFVLVVPHAGLARQPRLLRGTARLIDAPAPAAPQAAAPRAVEATEREAAAPAAWPSAGPGTGPRAGADTQGAA